MITSFTNQYGKFKKWAPREDAVVINLYPSCESAEEVSLLLGRTPQAVKTRAANLGLVRTKEAASKALSQSLKGKNLGKKRPDLVRNRKKNLSGSDNPFYGRNHSEESRSIISEKAKLAGTFKKLSKDPGFQRKRLRALLASPNKAEIFLDKLIQEVCPNEYKFTGDGSFIIDGLNPDWVNVNGQKKVIELFGEQFHNPEVIKSRIIAYRSTEKGRKKTFKRFGYKTLVIWGKELKDKSSLMEKILKFHKS